MNSSELKATIIASDSTRSPVRTAIPSRARGAGSFRRGPAAPHPQPEGGESDEREGRGVDRHRQLEPADREREAARERPEAEAQ